MSVSKGSLVLALRRPPCFHSQTIPTYATTTIVTHCHVRGVMPRTSLAHSPRSFIICHHCIGVTVGGQVKRKSWKATFTPPENLDRQKLGPATKILGVAYLSLFFSLTHPFLEVVSSSHHHHNHIIPNTTPYRPPPMPPWSKLSSYMRWQEHAQQPPSPPQTRVSQSVFAILGRSQLFAACPLSRE